MSIKSEPLLDFENQLLNSLKPVDPSTKFVDHLRDRLVTPAVTIYEPEPDPTQVLSGIGLALTIIFVGLITGLGLLSLKRALLG